jgi:acyl-CoA synthetase (NDP forming)
LAGGFCEDKLIPFQLDKLIKPQSIAVVGASERPDAIGTRVIRNLRRFGYGGRIYPVNPRYSEVEGLPCVASLSALPEQVDAAFLAVPAAQGPDLVDEAAAAGIRALFMNANGFADGGDEGTALQNRIELTANENGIAICGPNNLGLINVHDKIAVWTPRYVMEPREGPLALISQSGSVAIVLADDERKIGFSYIITAGNEAVVSVADYLRHCVHDDRVGVILLYLETIRKVDAFAAAAREALERGKPVVVLKLGRSESGRALVQAHTGSLAGEDRLYDEFFRKLGIIRVRDLDEMIETALLLSTRPKPIKARGLVTVTLSGGEAALIADTANDLGVDLMPLSAGTIKRLRPAFPSHATIRNPVDSWGLGFTAERFAMIVEALTADPEIGTIAFSVDAPGAGGADVPYACTMAEVCVSAAAKADQRLIFFNNSSGTGPNGEVLSILDRARIPYLSGMRTALAAIGYVQREAPRPPTAEANPRPAQWIEGIASGSDTTRFRMLGEVGLPMAECAPVASSADAVSIAQRLGYPLVLKGSAPHLAHKSDLGLVRIGLKTPADIEAAYGDISKALTRHGGDEAPAEIYLQKMAQPGIELILGIRNEPGFGSFIIVGVGGIFVEVINKVALRLGPVDAAEAHQMLLETPAGKLLGGVRGHSPYDIAAAADAVVALSRLGAATVGKLASIEINPLIVHEKGAAGVDVLIERADNPRAGRP